MGLVGDFLTDKFVPRSERIQLFRTWGSGLGMLPIGGAAAWGNASHAPDDTPEMVARNITHGRAAPGARPGRSRAPAHGSGCARHCSVHGWRLPLSSPFKPYVYARGRQKAVVIGSPCRQPGTPPSGLCGTHE
jgi:hypothetical protein